MKKTILALVLTGASFVIVQAQTVWVGGEQMYPAKDIIDNAIHSKDHTTLVTAVQAAGLVETLKGKGPFTVFAPTNQAFAKLPDGTVDALLKPESKAALTSVLTYHVIPGKFDSEAISKAIKDGNGKAELKTVNGATLWAIMNGPRNVVLKDEQGNIANITTYDVYQSNGVIHVIDTIVMP